MADTPNAPPRPWRIDDDLGIGSWFAIRDALNRGFLIIPSDDERLPAMKHAVLAVNLHERLCEALEDLLSAARPGWGEQAPRLSAKDPEVQDALEVLRMAGRNPSPWS